MRKIYSIIASVILIFSSSCSPDLLDTMPTDGLGSPLVFTTTENAKGALNGLHRLMFSDFGGQAYGGFGCIMHQNDILCEDVILPARANGFFVGDAQWNGHTIETYGFVSFAWTFYYRIIANANQIIGYIDGAEGPQNERNLIKGQAYAYRAWAHYMAVQLWGKRWDSNSSNTNLGIPIMTFESPEAKARNTVFEVYKIVHEDLDKAMSLLEGYSRPNKSFLDITVVRGIKARVLLTQGRWEEAAKMAEQAITSKNGFMSKEQHYEGYNNYDNSEWMWGSKIGLGESLGHSSFLAYMSYNFSSRSIVGAPRIINKVLYDKLSATDVRRNKLWIPNPNTTAVVTPGGGSKFSYMHQKFKAESETSSDGCIPYMRLPEMYLIAAEGYARAGNSSAAQNKLYNLMITRDPSYVKSTKTGNALIEEILIARRLELWGEGFRFTDLKRLNQNLDRRGTNQTTSITSASSYIQAGDARWQWKIPKSSEMDTNDLMQQNP